MSVIIGHALTRDGVGVPGLTVSIVNHPEFGQTTSQADGQYALAVPAGRWTVDLHATSFIGVQRWVTARARDFSAVKDAVVVRRDSKSTVFQVAQGGFHQATPVNDKDGARTTSLFIPQGTSAWLRHADGGTTPAPSLTLRATEATVGPTGQAAMPATLPPTTAYTWAADISADEAVAANALGIGFDRDVAIYTDDFLGFRVGAQIPLGVYNSAIGAWESSPNAHVLKVVTGGIDVTGDDQPDSVLPLLDGEAAALSAHFAVGTKLVRSLTRHFSAIDTNPCWVCIGSCAPAGGVEAPAAHCDCNAGSLVRIQNQTLSEFTGISGTPYSLAWHSDRSRARQPGIHLYLGNLDDGGTPIGVAGSYFSLEVAGQTISYEGRDAGVGASVYLPWDGKDAFGRPVTGPVPAVSTTAYGFTGVEVESRGGIQVPAQSDFASWPPAGAVKLSDTREVAYVLRRTSHSLGDWVPRENLGNLSLTVLHGYSQLTGTLFLGDGSEVQASSAGATVQFLAGGDGRAGDGTFRDVYVGPRPPLSAAPSGAYFIGNNGRQLWLLDTTLNKARVVSGAETDGFAGDSLDATKGVFNGLTAVKTDAEGNAYLVDSGNFRIRRIDAKSNVLTTVVGNGQRGFSADGTKATDSKLDNLGDLLLGRDGMLYFLCDSSDGRSQLLRRVTAAGEVQTVAGGAEATAQWELASPAELRIGSGLLLAEGPDSELYLAGYQNAAGQSDYVVRRISANGRVTLLAGGGKSADPRESRATSTCFSGISGVAVGVDGVVYVSESGGTGCGVRGPGIRAVMPSGDFVNVTGVVGTSRSLC